MKMMKIWLEMIGRQSLNMWNVFFFGRDFIVLRIKACAISLWCLNLLVNCKRLYNLNTCPFIYDKAKCRDFFSENKSYIQSQSVYGRIFMHIVQCVSGRFTIITLLNHFNVVCRHNIMLVVCAFEHTWAQNHA